MTVEQLKRLDNINHFAQIFRPMVRTVEYARFAILTDPEREELLVFMEETYPDLHSMKNKKCKKAKETK